MTRPAYSPDEESMIREMTAEMRDVIGSGYIPEYYRQLALPFYHIAKGFGAAMDRDD
jgi:hypothetical protein